jgi:serine/threonine protein kinase
MSAHLTAPIPHPSQRRPEMPAGFDKVIESGMAKNPEDRYASAGELARAAHQALSAPDQDDVDTILAYTQAATTDDRGQAQCPATKATSLLVQRFGPVAPIALALLALIAVFIIVGVSSVIVQHWLTQQPPAFPPPQQSAPSSWPSQVEPPSPPSLVELPFTGLRYPMGVAVESTATQWGRR